MKVVKINKEAWQALSEGAHRIVFKEEKPASLDRIDFVLTTEDREGGLVSYVSCRETDRDTLYWQYGGSFPGSKGTPKSLEACKACIRWCKESGYKRVWFLVENTNRPMLKLAMHTGFVVNGLRAYNGSILLEHLLEF